MGNADAAALHRDSIVIDAHCDTLFVPFGERRDLVPRTERSDIDVPRLLEGGVTCQFMAMLVNDEHHGAAKALAGVDSFLDACGRCPDLVPATTAADVVAAKAAGR
ncbi:MAG: membrane dipeptidase, partial [Anaerolineae bacterium]